MTKAVLWSAAAAAVLYAGFSLIAGWNGVAAAVSAIGWPVVAAALGLALANYVLRLVRWRMYLTTLGHPVGLRSAASIYFAGFAFTATPGKAGELLRGVFLKHEGVPLLVSTAAFLSERLGDLIGVLVIALPGAMVHPQGGLIVGIGAAIIAALVMALSQRRALEGAVHVCARSRFRLVVRLGALARLLVEARRCHEPRVLVLGLALSLAAWCAEAYAFHLVLAAMGVQIELGFAMSIYALAMLAGAVSFLPGGVGGAEAVMTALLMVSGANEAKAVAATLVIRLATLWFAVALGALVLLVDRRRLWPRPV